MRDFLAVCTWCERVYHTVGQSQIICIKMIFQRSLFCRLGECFLCSVKQTKAIFLEADFFELWRKEMVDAFIKYGNLLNGLWQSHWRSLFRCRWLPPWLLLLLVELPVRKKGKKSLPVFHWLTANHSCLSAYRMNWLTDWLTDCTPSQQLFPPNKFSIKAPGKIEGRRTQRKENKPHLSLASLSQWKNKTMNLYHPEPLLLLMNTTWTNGQTCSVSNSFTMTFFSPYAPWLLTNMQAKLGYCTFNCCIAYRIHCTAGWADKNTAA